MTKHTTHHENETLFWAKAASVLGLPQLKMHRSRVPYSNTLALKALNSFCVENNLGELKQESLNRKTIFEMYLSLIVQNGPLFLEKSPHHLFNQSNLDLISEFKEKYQDKINFKILGLVRHPLSVIYSGWDRWKHDCSEFEQEWLISNTNLLKNKEALDLEIIRYEDLVSENAASLKDKLALEPVSSKFEFKSGSLEKWKSDKNFAHQLSKETMDLAKKFGYTDFETSEETLTWKLKSWSTYAGVEMKRLLRASAVYLMLS
ncbi:hypothetical protein D770_00695 [Flammeovirgaceae bacterium 311]|nr:hypothetical protein D770_00695 [Flammeovirgaceae bacterium 311]